MAQAMKKEKRPGMRARQMTCVRRERDCESVWRERERCGHRVSNREATDTREAGVTATATTSRAPEHQPLQQQG